MIERKNLKEVEKAVFIIDMNIGFCEEGNLADPSIKHIVPNIIMVADQVIEEGEALFIVNDKHTKASVELQRYLEHCMGDKESKTIKELAIYEEYANKVFYKNSTCALFAPGVIDTSMNKGFDEETIQALREETPVGRLGTPEDIARAIAFLADEKSGFITGQTLGIDGGFI